MLIDKTILAFLFSSASILAQSCYMMMAIAGAIGLIWKMKIAHVVAGACAPIGASIAVMSLATGAIWGKPTWGAWWVWDARLTSMLVLLFLYIGRSPAGARYSTILPNT
jgi:heme exporter protein C